MNEIFLTEWKQYRQGLARPSFQGEAPRGEAAFDADVKVGEIRIFADTNRPFVALVLEDKGLAGRRLVPVSPFSVPASARERLVGTRVLQLWNACLAARRFTDRSWLVDTVSSAELAFLKAAVAAAAPGRVTAGDGPLARYEREFLVSGGTFIPFVRSAEGDGHREWEVRRSFFSAFARVAACFVLCMGAFYLLIGAGRERLRVWREASALVYAAPEETVELLEMPADEVAEAGICENDQIDISFINESTAAMGSVPTVTQGCTVALTRLRDTPRLPAGLLHLTEGDALIDPCVLPLSVVECGTGGVLMSVTDGASAGSSAGACPPPSVDCRSAACPWDAEAKLVSVRVGETASARIEVFFDKERVGGYRLVSGPGPELVYEAVPRAGAALGDGFCQVTVRWPSEGGERRRVESVRPVDTIGFERPGVRPRATAPTSPDDVPVDVRF